MESITRVGSKRKNRTIEMPSRLTLSPHFFHFFFHFVWSSKLFHSCSITKERIFIINPLWFVMNAKITNSGIVFALCCDEKITRRVGTKGEENQLESSWTHSQTYYRSRNIEFMNFVTILNIVGYIYPAKWAIQTMCLKFLGYQEFVKLKCQK